MAICLFSNFAELCKVSARLDDIDIGHFIRIFGRLKNKKNTSKGGTLVIHFDSDYILEAIVYIAIKVSIRPVYHNVNNICLTGFLSHKVLGKKKSSCEQGLYHQTICD